MRCGADTGRNGCNQPEVDQGQDAAVNKDRSLSLLTAALRATLANLEARVALANHVDSATTSNNLAVGMTKFKRTDGGNNFHGFNSYATCM